MLKKNTIHPFHALEGLRRLPDESVDMVITSPPYFQLRDYGGQTDAIWDGNPFCKHDFRRPIVLERSGGGDKSRVNHHRQGVGNFRYESAFCKKCGAWKGQLGLEPDFHLYVKHLLDIFDEIKRVLKKHGTCWVNLGDTFGRSGVALKTSALMKTFPIMVNRISPDGSVGRPWNKCLLGLPERFTLGMLGRGWNLRNRIIWHKPNHVPSPVQDRLTNSWEYLFLFTKSKNYYFNLDAIRKPHKRGTPKAERDYLRMIQGRQEFGGKGKISGVQCSFIAGHPKGKNPGDFWSISCQPFKEAHFAVFPEKLIETPILAGCPEKVCTKCGIPKSVKPEPCKPVCECKTNDINTNLRPGLVLDPFMGSGTTAVMAKKLGRDFIGFELNPDYIRMAEKRISKADTQKKQSTR